MAPSRNGKPSVEGRTRGRPAVMSPEALLERIQRLSRSGHGLFRIDHTHAVLYARARRCFGSWAAAVAAAGLDYGRVMQEARARSLGRKRRAIGRRTAKR